MELLATLTTYNSLIVLFATALLGIACGVVGSFTVLRERALIGDCIAHASLPGVCASYLLLHDRSFLTLFIGASITGLLSAIAVWGIRSNTRIKDDTALALVLSVFFGIGITLSRIIQNTPAGNAAGIDTFILGKAATIAFDDLVCIAIVACIVVTTTILLFKELTVVCFDGAFALSQGIPVAVLDIVLMVLVCLCTAAGLPAVGAVLIAALLIFPAVTARLWSDRIEIIVPLAACLGLLACLAGTCASALIHASTFPQGLPTGPLIVLSAAMLFVCSLLSSLLRRRKRFSRVGGQGDG